MTWGHRHQSSVHPARRCLKRHLRRVVAWFLLVPLLFNIVGGMALSGEAAGQDLSARTVVVCTAAGMVAVDLDGNASTPVSHASLCAFCLPLMHAGAGLAPAGAIVAPPPQPSPPLSHPARLPPRCCALAPHPARAPPAAA
ncbi:MAG: DUF2946 family protein [Bacteroidota bacterium]